MHFHQREIFVFFQWSSLRKWHEQELFVQVTRGNVEGPSRNGPLGLPWINPAVQRSNNNGFIHSITLAQVNTKLRTTTPILSSTGTSLWSKFDRLTHYIWQGSAIFFTTAQTKYFFDTGTNIHVAVLVKALLILMFNYAYCRPFQVATRSFSSVEMNLVQVHPFVKPSVYLLSRSWGEPIQQLQTNIYDTSKVIDLKTINFCLRK